MSVTNLKREPLEENLKIKLWIINREKSQRYTSTLVGNLMLNSYRTIAIVQILHGDNSCRKEKLFETPGLNKIEH